jgi:omega-amidase
MSNSAWNGWIEPVRKARNSLVPGPTTEKWGKMAKQYGYYIVAGIARRHSEGSGIIYNSAVLINPQGQVQGVYSKVVPPLYLHSWPDETGEPIIIEEAEIFRRGDALPVFKTAIGTIGIQICQDAVYPEFIRVMALKGAQLIIQILNGPAVQTQHEPDITPLTTRVHAFDNGVYILLANKCGKEAYDFMGRRLIGTFHGESHVADPYGNFVAKAAPEKEELLLAEIDLGKVAKAQWDSKFLRDWRPDLLGPLAHQGFNLGSDEL